ncbi:hypothetical protein ACIPRD_25695 [Streptomyces sp. NPDC090108]
MDIDQVEPGAARDLGAPFGGTTAEPGFAGWVRHWAGDREWFDAV